MHGSDNVKWRLVCNLIMWWYFVPLPQSLKILSIYLSIYLLNRHMHMVLTMRRRILAYPYTYGIDTSRSWRANDMTRGRFSATVSVVYDTNIRFWHRCPHASQRGSSIGVREVITQYKGGFSIGEMGVLFGSFGRCLITHTRGWLGMEKKGNIPNGYHNNLNPKNKVT